MKKIISKLTQKKEPSLSDWSFRLPGLALAITGIYLQIQSMKIGNCGSSFSAGDYFSAPAFISLALIGIIIFSIPYVIMIFVLIFNIVKGKKTKWQDKRLTQQSDKEA